MCRKMGLLKKVAQLNIISSKKIIKGNMISLNVWKDYDKNRFDPLPPRCSKEKQEEIGIYSL